MRLSQKILLAVGMTGALLSAGCGGGGGGGGGNNVAPAGSAATTLPEARAAHAAVLLRTGDVLVVGGVDASGRPLRSTVIVSPTSLKSGPDLLEARTGHSATLLSTGEVFIAGGSSDDQGLNRLDSSELFDPVTSTVTAGPALGEARARHASIAVITSQGERVLLLGGAVANTGAMGQVQLTPVATAELVDPVAGTQLTLSTGLNTARYDGIAARLDSGKILIVSGSGATGAAGAETFDPNTLAFAPAQVVAAREGAAVASRGREVLVAGGQSNIGIEDTSEIYDDLSGTSAQGKRLGVARRDATATIVGQDILLIGGRVQANGVAANVEKVSGTSLGAAQVSNLKALNQGRWAHSSTSMAGNKVAVVGGFDANGVALASIEWVDLTSTAPVPSSTGPGATPGVIIPPPTTTPPPPPTTTPPPPTTTPPPPPPTTGGSGSGSGGLGGLLSSLFGGSGGSSSLVSTLINAALQALTSNPGGGFSGFLQAFLQNVVQGLLGGGSGSTGSGSGLSGILTSLLGSLTGGSGGSSSGLSGLLSSLLGSLGGSGSGSTGGSSSGLSGLISSLLGGLTGGSSGSGSSGGLGGLLGSLFGGGSGSTGGSTGGSTSTAPAITSMTPNTGRAGDSVTISGTNFGNTVLVRFNGVAAQVQSATRQGGVVTIRCTAPQGVTTGMVTVETGGTTANAGTFTVI